MKIGILTYHWVYNFGANLQVLSTIGYFRKHGYDPVVINWVPADTKAHYDRVTSLDMINKFQEFQKENYPLTSLCNNAKDVAEVIKHEKIEMVFIGADTLFMLRKPHFSLRTFKTYYPKSDTIFPNPFWGEFLSYVDVPVVGYSIATLTTNPLDFSNIKEEASRYLKRFNKLTVRDAHTQHLVSSFTDGILFPEITPDPVFGFNDNVDISVIEPEIKRKFNLPDNYYLLCMPKPYNKKLQKWAKLLSDIIAKSGSVLYELPRQTGNKCFDIAQLNHQRLSPLEWYVIIKNSKGYIGGLMHPLVICIHNKVPFYCIDYYGNYKTVFNIPIRGTVDKKTSKSFQIVKECKLLKYYHNIREHFATIPSPDEVFSMLNDYDYSTLNKDSEFKRNYYFKSIGEIFN